MTKESPVLVMVARLNAGWVRPAMLTAAEQAVTTGMVYDGDAYWSPTREAYCLTDEGFRRYESQLSR